MSCKFTGWYGRVGNNVQQITNAIYFSMKNGRKLECDLHHEIFSPFVVDFSNDDDLQETQSYFYYYRPSKKVNSESVDFECIPDECDMMRPLISKSFVRKLLKFDLDGLEPYSDDTIVIHLRFGDVFNNSPNDCYVPNPISYYREVMSNFGKTIIVTEDPNNFIVREISRDKNVQVKSSSVQSDFMTLLRAKSLCTSGVGTFSIAAALLSKRLQNLYCTSLYLDNHLNPDMLRHDSEVNVKMTQIDEDAYIKIGEWKRSSDQVEKIMKYEVKI